MFPVRTMCRVFGVSPSGFHAWHGREPSARAIEDARLTARIRHYHARSRGAYGAPNIHADLRDEGIGVGRKRVARLMKAEGLRGVCRRKWVTTTTRDPEARPAPDLVERRFSADGPDRLWVADITYIPTWAGFLYLAVVLDAFSRRIVGWAMAEHPPNRARALRAEHGDRPASPSSCRASFRPGHAVHLDRVRASL
jgi:putative transposase